LSTSSPSLAKSAESIEGAIKFCCFIGFSVYF
jgi:hypothetical protein